MRKCFSSILSVGVLVAAAATVSAAPIAYEGFDMAIDAGVRINDTAGTGTGSAAWNAGQWGGNDGGFKKSNATLSYGLLVTSPGRARTGAPTGQGNDQNFRTFGAQPASGQYWVSIMMRIGSNNTSSSIGYSLFDGGNERNFVGKPGFVFWAATSGGGDASALGQVGTIMDFGGVPQNNEAFLLSLYDMSAGKQWHWVDPDISNGQPSFASSWNGTAGAGLDPFSFDRVRLGNFGDGDQSFMDEFRVGTTFGDVAPLIPEPAGLALLGLAALPMLRRRA